MDLIEENNECHSPFNVDEEVDVESFSSVMRWTISVDSAWDSFEMEYQ